MPVRIITLSQGSRKHIGHNSPNDGDIANNHGGHVEYRMTEPLTRHQAYMSCKALAVHNLTRHACLVPQVHQNAQATDVRPNQLPDFDSVWLSCRPRFSIYGLYSHAMLHYATPLGNSPRPC